MLTSRFRILFEAISIYKISAYTNHFGFFDQICQKKGVFKKQKNKKSKDYLWILNIQIRLQPFAKNIGKIAQNLKKL